MPGFQQAVTDSFERSLHIRSLIQTILNDSDDAVRQVDREPFWDGSTDRPTTPRHLRTSCPGVTLRGVRLRALADGPHISTRARASERSVTE
jgi:hypothetical protein